MSVNFPIQVARPTFVSLPGGVNSGQAGLNAYQLAVLGAPGVPPFVGSMAEWLTSLTAPDSSYQRYLETTTDSPVLSEEAWTTARGGVVVIDGFAKVRWQGVDYYTAVFETNPNTEPE